MLQHYGTILCLEKAPLGGWWEDALRHLLRLRGGESWSLELHWYWWMADFMWTIGRSQEMHAVEGSNFDRLAIHLNELFQVLLFAKVMRDPDNGTQPWKMSAMSVVFGEQQLEEAAPLNPFFNLPSERHLAWLRLHFLWHLRSLRRGTGRHERVWSHSRPSIFILQACNQFINSIQFIMI